jgi:hypothetical protein
MRCVLLLSSRKQVETWIKPESQVPMGKGNRAREIEGTKIPIV